MRLRKALGVDRESRTRFESSIDDFAADSSTTRDSIRRRIGIASPLDAIRASDQKLRLGLVTKK
jgi:hypothetical protein